MKTNKKAMKNDKKFSYQVARFLRENWRKTQKNVTIIGGALCQLDPDHDTRFPSQSKNVVGYTGVGSSIQDKEIAPDVEKILKYYQTGNAPHCFITVHPSAFSAQIQYELLAQGCTRFDIQEERPRYITLVRTLQTNIWPESNCQYSVQTLPARSGDPSWVERFGVFTKETCIARAALHIIKPFALLAGAYTETNYRGKGAQSALLDIRLKRAKALDCHWAVSETMTNLTVSLQNLKRFGFAVLFEKPVYEWRPSAK